MQQAGVDSNPPDDARAVIIQLSKAWAVAVAVNDGITPDSSLETGEFQIYSQDGGVRKSTITLKKDGSIDIVAAGDMNIAGNLNVTGDVIADSSGTAISLIDHYHQGNLGFPTGASLMTGGGTTPSTPPSSNSSGDIIDGSGINLTIHFHSDPQGGSTGTPQN